MSKGNGNGIDMEMGKLYFPFVEGSIIRGEKPGIILGALEKGTAAGVLAVAYGILAPKTVERWCQDTCAVCRQKATAVAKNNGGDSIDGS